MLCPECEKEMLVVEMNDIEIDWCPDCSGVWLDEGELELLADTKKNDATIFYTIKTPKGIKGNRKCPRCSKQMLVVNTPSEPSIELDVCANGHGAWFDKGELEKIITFIKGEPVADVLLGIFKK